MVVEKLSQPVQNEAIAGWTTSGNTIVDRTHQMRTIQADVHGSNVLFDLESDIFGDQRQRFAEFVAEACKRSSFTVQKWQSVLDVLKVVNRIRREVEEQSSGSAFSTLPSTVPHFRIEIPSTRPGSPSRLETEGESRACDKALALSSFTWDLILHGEHPDILRGRSLLHRASGEDRKVTGVKLNESVVQRRLRPRQIKRSAPRVGLDESALVQRFNAIVGSDFMIQRARQADKAVIFSQLAVSREGQMDQQKFQSLISHISSFDEGRQMLRLCHTWELGQADYDDGTCTS